MDNKNPTKQATLKDIAERTGVTAMAVSQVLNGTGRISIDTRRRVIEAAKELNYSPNFIAKSLRMKETRSIGIVVSDSSEIFFMQVFRGIQDESEEAGYSVMIANTDSRTSKEKSMINMLLSKRIDGLVIASPTLMDQKYIDYLKHCGIPFVVLSRQWGEGVNTVISDNEEGGYLAADYLLRTGSRKIFYLSLPTISQIGETRLKGHIRALNEHGVDFRKERIKTTISTFEGGIESMKELMEAGFDGDALCCDDDRMAVGAMDVLLNAGYKIPEQVRVCGFNDLEIAPYVQIPLTSVRQHRYKLGREGARLLFEQIKNPSISTRKMVLPVDLILRKST
jgi:DNA-binding LacI/PurR family transcriptional regulator